jgi:tetratricopeptide (TPR) repeat protein
VLATAALAIAGCASVGASRVGGPGLAGGAAVELVDTPFYPQRDHQCGPAALATVLGASGAAIDPETLIEQVYLPGRKGSLQTELIAAARRHDRLPYTLDPDPNALLAELDAGRPVLVLQKLGAGPWPGWHYAVVVGYDPAQDEWLLRSGTTARETLSSGRFLATWQRAGSWAVVVLPPGELPARADATRYLTAAAALESVGRASAAEQAYRAAAREWPDAALPWLGLANLSYAQGDFGAAERGYAQAIARDPGNVAAHNNRADALIELGCIDAARIEADAAVRLAADSSLAPQAKATRQRAFAATATGRCPAVDDVARPQ